MRKEQRVKEVIRLLSQESSGLTTKELAAALNVSERTIYSDLNFIESELSLPLQRPSGKSGTPDGCYSLKLNDSSFKFAPWHSQILEHPMGSSISLIGKREVEFLASEFLTESFSTKSKELTGKLKILAYELIDCKEGQVKMRHFLQALKENAEMEITYTTFSRENELSKRIIQPYGLVWFNASWYAVAYCRLRQSVRIFKLDRVIQTRMLDSHFALPLDFSLDEYFAQSWGIVVDSNQKPKEVKLLFSPKVANEVIKYRYHPSQQNRWVDHGWLEVNFKIAAVTEMKNWVLSWGEDVLVIEPEELRQELVQLLKVCLKNWDFAENDSQGEYYRWQ
jgi:proteasome accessory factor B